MTLQRTSAGRDQRLEAQGGPNLTRVRKRAIRRHAIARPRTPSLKRRLRSECRRSSQRRTKIGDYAACRQRQRTRAQRQNKQDRGSKQDWISRRQRQCRKTSERAGLLGLAGMTVVIGFVLESRNGHHHGRGPHAGADAHYDLAIGHSRHEAGWNGDLQQQRQRDDRAGEGPIGKDEATQPVHSLRS